MMDKYVETVTDKQIETVERITRGQSDPETWRDLKRVKLTASNFHAASIRQKEPDNLLKNIMYIKATKSPKPLLQYGLQHEDDAVASYVAFQAAQGNTSLRVQKVGTIISKERSGLGASLDRMVYDPKAKGNKTGGLEVKCPFSKKGMSLEEACEDRKFYLQIIEEGSPKLKFGHKYFYQVQGQIFVCTINSTQKHTLLCYTVFCSTQ